MCWWGGSFRDRRWFVRIREWGSGPFFEEGGGVEEDQGAEAVRVCELDPACVELFVGVKAQGGIAGGEKEVDAPGMACGVVGLEVLDDPGQVGVDGAVPGGVRAGQPGGGMQGAEEFFGPDLDGGVIGQRRERDIRGRGGALRGCQRMPEGGRDRGGVWVRGGVEAVAGASEQAGEEGAVDGSAVGVLVREVFDERGRVLDCAQVCERGVGGCD